MTDAKKTKQQLIAELEKIRKQLAEFEQLKEKQLRTEEQYRILFENMPIGIAIASLDGEVLIFNDAMLQMMGYDATELMHINVQDTFLNPDERMLLMQLIQAADLVRDFEVELKHKDGSPFYANLTTNRLVLQGKEVLLTMTQDITERKLAETALQESEEKFRSLSEQSPNMIFINQKGKIIYANQACEKTTGYKKEELYAPDFDFQILFAPESLETVMENYGKHSKGEEVPPFEYVNVCKDGRRISAYTATKLISYGGENAILGVVTDITEQKRVEAALRKSQKELAIRNDIINVFLTSPEDKIFAEVLEIVLEALFSKQGIFGYIDEMGALVCPSLTRNVWQRCQIPDKHIVFPRESWGKSIWGRAIRNQKSLYANKPFSVPEGHIPITRALAVPIVYQKDVVGLLQIANKDTDYDEEDKELLETIAKHIAPILHAKIQRERQEKQQRQILEQLSESEEKHRLIFDNSPLGILHYNSEGVITACNEALAKILGAPKDKLVGFNMRSSLMNQGVRDAVESSLAGETSHFEGEYVSVLSGKACIMKAEFGPIFGEDGSIAGGIGIADDITEKKRTEAIVQKSEELSSLFSIISILTQNLTLKEKLARAFERVINLFKIEVGGGIYLLNSKTGFLHLFVHQGLSPSFVEKVKVVSLDDTYSGKAIQTKKPVIIEDLFTNSELKKGLRKPVKKASHRAFASIPIISEGKGIGTINIAHSTAGKTFSAIEINLLQVIAQQFAQTIENHRFVAAMLESESQYQEIFDNVTDMILITDLDTNIRTANPSTLHWLGYSEAELLTMKLSDLVKDKADLMKTRKLLTHDRADEDWPLTFFANFHTKDNREIPAEMDITLIRRENKPTGFMAVVRDITERLKLQQKTLHTQKMASLSLLVSGISHEFNNILGTIHTWTTFASRNTDNQETIKEMLDTVEKQTQRGRIIVRDLLLFSGNYQPAFKAIKLSTLLEKILAKKRDEFNKKKIQVQSFYHYKGLIEADSYQLEIMINNLLSNSIHALAGKRQKKIIIRVVARQETVKMTIFDNGRGMSEKTASQIFEPFFTTKSKSKEGKGIGVGLAICYGIVENHGGSISVESQSKVGTTFFITLNKKFQTRSEH